MDKHPANAQNSTRHETTDADVGVIVKFAIGLFVALVLTLVVTRWVFNYFAARQGVGPPASPFENSRELPPGDVPRLQVVPPQELHTYKEQQENLLKSYGWVDEKDGIVRIPIDRAMGLLLQKGLPVQTSPPQAVLQPGAVPQYAVPKGYTPVH
jgi:hypothetical protein